MRLVSTPRIDFARSLVDELWPRLRSGRTVLAVDGSQSSGVAAFADDLAAVIDERDRTVFRAHADGFRHSRAYLDDFGRESPEREVRYALDEVSLRRAMLEPFEIAGSAAFVTSVIDAARDMWVEPRWLTGPPDAVLVIDGRFLLRTRLRDMWDASISIDAPPSDAAERWAREHPIDADDQATLTIDGALLNSNG